MLFVPIVVSAQTFDSEANKYNRFFYYLNSLYVDSLDNRALTETAIRAVLSELDPHSAYISAEEMREQAEQIGGSFSGIGIEFDVIRDTLSVVATIAGAPAEAVGMVAGDKIVAVDGRSVVGIRKSEVPKLLRGPKGTHLTVEAVRAGRTLQFKLTRDDIPIETIDAAYRIGTTGYIKVNRFAETTMTEFRKAYGSLGRIDALVIDLRGNGGGLMSQAIEMAEFFLPKGSLIVSTEGREESGNYRYVSRRDGTFIDLPLAVLIDGQSASASEIVSGAIQDHDRGVVVGRQSFGKGLVQRQVALGDGSVVRITTSYYLTPSGRKIQRAFEKGKTMDYYIDHANRMVDRHYRDSIDATAPRFRTLRSNRTVLGGGGITPDLYIEQDTTRNYTYFNSLVRAGVPNNFVNRQLELHRSEWQRLYPTFERFEAGFELTDQMMSSLADEGRKAGVDTTAMAEGQELLKLYIKALTARKLWSTNEYFKIINRFDNRELEQALAIVGDKQRYRKILDRK